MMRRVIRLIVLLAFLWAIPSKAQTFDAYGGLVGTNCPSSPGYFTVQKIGARWWICTPATPQSHGLFFESVGAFQVPTLAKYGNSRNTAAVNLINEVIAWNFNGIGELSDQIAEPIGSCSGCVKLPEVQTLLISNYAMVNLNAHASRPVKNMNWGLNSNYNTNIYQRRSFTDFFDPQYSVWLAGFLLEANTQLYLNSSYVIGLFMDDTDWFWGMGAGPDFQTIPTGHNNSNTAAMVLVTSPTQTFNLDPASRNTPELYTDTKVYSKVAMASPPATCSITTPCSLRDYLAKKYGTIGALNTAWGSNYTTFDSAGTQVNGESIGTGTGAQTTFNFTLAHANVSPTSIAIKLATVLDAGDCPTFEANGGYGAACASAFGPASFVSAGTMNYATGAGSITFASAPGNGVAITADYVYGGWQYGTGLMDEDGRNSWVGTNYVCLNETAICGIGNTFPAPNANATLASDLNAWVAQYAAQYFGAINTQIKLAAPHMLYLGADSVGTWGVPARKEILQAAAQYTDGLFTNWYGDQPDQSTANAQYSFLTHWYGDKPILNFITITACQDSATAGVQDATCGGLFHQTTQALRAQQWNTIVKNMLNTPSFNNTYQWVGIAWWGLHDLDSPLNNWGLKSITDNAYNGHDAVSGSIACLWNVALTCGSEPAPGGSATRPFGDLTGGPGGVARTNTLWFYLNSATVAPGVKLTSGVQVQ